MPEVTEDPTTCTLPEWRLHQIRTAIAFSSMNGPDTSTGMLVDLMAELDRIRALRMPDVPAPEGGHPRSFLLIVADRSMPGAQWPDGRIALEVGEPYGLMALAGTVDELLAMQPEGSRIEWAFPLPLRPDGTHFYVSTYCLHSDHAACRLTCLCCGQPCQCDCGHPKPEPECPYSYHDEHDEGVDFPCVCEPHAIGGAHGCPEGCPTHNHGGEDVPEGAIGGRATDEELGEEDRCPACGCVVGPECEACERDCRSGEPLRTYATQVSAIAPGGNAEDCPRCSGTNPPYPFICPGHPADGEQQ